MKNKCFRNLNIINFWIIIILIYLFNQDSKLKTQLGKETWLMA